MVTPETILVQLVRKDVRIEVLETENAELRAEAEALRATVLRQAQDLAASQATAGMRATELETLAARRNGDLPMVEVPNPA